MPNTALSKLFYFLEKDPTDSFTLYSIAYEYMRSQQHEEAFKYFEKLRELHPDYLGLYYHLGKCLQKLDQEEQAEAIYQDGIQRARAAADSHSLAELQTALNEMLFE